MLTRREPMDSAVVTDKVVPGCVPVVRMVNVVPPARVVGDKVDAAVRVVVVKADAEGRAEVKVAEEARAVVDCFAYWTSIAMVNSRPKRSTVPSRYSRRLTSTRTELSTRKN
jgi:hypothetical protein